MSHHRKFLTGVQRIALVELAERLTIGLVHFLGQDDLRLGQQVAGAARRGATPCPLTRNFVPLDVPGGMVRATVPVGVGRSTLAPEAASPKRQRDADVEVVSPPGKTGMRRARGW